MIDIMNGSGKIGYLILSLGVFLLGMGVSDAYAETITSPSYKIDGNFGGSFGGQASSTSYKMTAIGGEAIVGSGVSGSYIIDQQQAGLTTPSMQLAVQLSGLVGFYPMDENAGTMTADASQYQNNGALNTTAAMGVTGKLGGAVDINGPTDSSGDGSVNIPDNANLPSGTQMTFEAWVNADNPNIAVQKSIATHYHPGTSESWRINVSSGRIWVYISAAQSGGGSHYVATDSSAFNVAGAWRHVAVVYDGGLAQVDRVKIYIDGVRVAIASSTDSIPASLQNSSAKLSIGAMNGAASAFPGLIDHVKIFNRALGHDEIAAEYAAQNANVATGLVLGTVTSESKVTQVDAIVRTNVGGYSLAIHQDHDLQNGVNTIPAISGGSIASPLTWSDGITKGLGFTLMNAPNLDSKWSSGAGYAALPSSTTTFYTNTSHVTSSVDVINARLRLDTGTPQVPGSYTNNITYTGTMIP